VALLAGRSRAGAWPPRPVITDMTSYFGLNIPPQEEVVEVIGPSTASPAISERVGARRASRKAKRTAVRSQKARNAIKTAMEAENAMEATVEATTTRSGRRETRAFKIEDFSC
jgi:methylmalonyl-CoA mutase N-terminal domain/subunit